MLAHKVRVTLSHTSVAEHRRALLTAEGWAAFICFFQVALAKD